MTTDFWPLIILLGFAVYISRIAGVVLLPVDRLPFRVERGLRYLPAAILAALVAVNLVPGPGMNSSEYVAVLLAALLAAIVAARFKQPLLSLIAGSATLGLARAAGVI